MAPESEELVATLAEVARLEMGQSPPSVCVSDDLSAGIPFLQGNAEFTNRYPEARLSCARPQKVCGAGDVLISVRAPVGAINEADRAYCIGRGLAAVRFTTVDSRFGAHALRRSSQSLQRVSQGTTFAAVGREELGSLSLWVPALTEQRRIAEVLDTLDDLIRRTEQVIAKLKLVRQGLLHDLLTRGIDENGEVRDPKRRPQEFRASVLGVVPRNWQVLRVDTLGEVLTGTTPPSTDAKAWGPGLPFITPAEVSEEGSISPTGRTVSDHGQKYVRRLPTGSVLVVCIGSTIGKVGVTSWPCATNQQINALVPSEEHVPSFVGAAVRMNVRQIHRVAGLQAVPIVNKTQFGRMVVAVAPKEEQQRIADHIAAVEQRTASEEGVARELRSVRVGLAEDLLSGRLRLNLPADESAA